MSEEQWPDGFSPEMKRFLNWSRDERKLEATDYDEAEVVEGLQTLAISEGLSDPAYDFVMALFFAMTGSHPKFRLRLEKPPEGSDFARVKAWEKWRVSVELANEIDVSVANGLKQESAVQAVMAKHGLSRREVLRRLKECRSMRAANLEYSMSQGGAEVLSSVPKGYRITESGRLVPIGLDD